MTDYTIPVDRKLKTLRLRYCDERSFKQLGLTWLDGSYKGLTVDEAEDKYQYKISIGDTNSCRSKTEDSKDIESVKRCICMRVA